MREVAFDLEADNLLHGVSKCHIICTHNDEEARQYTDISEGLAYLNSFDVIVGHNIGGYDLPAVFKLYGWRPDSRWVDTHILSRLTEPDRPEGHSIEAWAKYFGTEKEGKDIEDWSTLTKLMIDRCKSDARICWLLWKKKKEEMGL